MAVKAKSEKRKAQSQSVKLKIGKMELKNPVILASGTCGFGKEIEELVDINALGAIVTKTITLRKREGNPSPRIAETHSGILNAIGLDNDGLKNFMFEKIPYLRTLKIPVIVSIAGDRIEEFVKLTEETQKSSCVKAIEVNLSCPNVSHEGTKHAILAQDSHAVEQIISRLRKITKRTLIAKLSPNVTDIKEIARSAERGGAEAVSLINTYPGMAVDVSTMKPKLGNVTGGLSGPAIKPLALKCVWDAYNSIKIPVIGSGGIMTAEDAIEFMLCGACAVQVGTANFVDPNAPLKIANGIKKYLKDKRISSIKGLVGKLKTCKTN
ncbi:MAG: dihydroorotate dehydrogenase [Candidatus Omnitrophica bacterium]|nr:dihydroorotate dehydrogenase [Candidatus Omnitrophota bacterium]